MRKNTCLLLLSTLMLSACNNGQGPSNVVSPVKGKKVAYIINMPETEIFSLCANQCVEISNKLGMSCDIFYSNGDDELFNEKVKYCASNNYDGLFLSHGGRDYSYNLITDLISEHKDLKIVTFDTDFIGEDGKEKKIDGVTQFFQDDVDLATTLLKYTTNTLEPNKSPVNILKVWVGPGYLSAFDRREVGYKAMEESGKIHTVETIGPSDRQNPTESMKEVMTETLKKYDESDIDAIWVAYDAYAQGCYQALKEANKNIPLVSIDLSNQDITYMLEENSLWKACACTDFKQNGEMGIRLLALELNNEYNLIKASNSTAKTDYIEMPASLITGDILKPNSNISNIYDVAPETYGNKSTYVTSDWLKNLIGY